MHFFLSAWLEEKKSFFLIIFYVNLSYLFSWLKESCILVSDFVITIIMF